MPKNVSLFDRKIKQIAFNKLPENKKEEHRKKIVEEIFSELTNKENRYIFYCPDIIVVNNLVKLIYETAYEIKKLGYSVLILHEINGFKCKWLLDEFTHLKELEIDYIITKKSGRSKKTRNDYSFKPSDTLIVPDHFQEMLDNLVNIKLIQKVVFVSSYSGLVSINPGNDYNTLGVSKVLFVEKKLQEDYNDLFNFSSTVIDKYPINKKLFAGSLRIIKEIFPVICISNIGNNDLTQEVINIFYNKYPQLRTFSFKILPRDNFEYYLNALKHSALLVILDKSLGNNQMILEALSIGIPVATFNRREVIEELKNSLFLGNDAFEIANSLAEFSTQWLNLSTRKFENATREISDKLNLESYSYENYALQLREVMIELQENRVEYFSKINKSIELMSETI